jgi:hypothetical protein
MKVRLILNEYFMKAAAKHFTDVYLVIFTKYQYTKVLYFWPGFVQIMETSKWVNINKFIDFHINQMLPRSRQPDRP